jgi:DNA-directed RNA polymerase specialized sigma24 family protein
VSGVLESAEEVRRCLERSRDWYLPATTSLVEIGAPPGDHSWDEVFRPGFLDSLDERLVLWRRLRCLEPLDRQILILLHVLGLPAAEVARRVGISRRHCFRRRNAALQQLVTAAPARESASSSLERRSHRPAGPAVVPF